MENRFEIRLLIGKEGGCIYDLKVDGGQWGSYE